MPIKRNCRLAVVLLFMVKQAVKLPGVSANTLRAWASNVKLRQHRHPVNNYRLIRRDEVLELVKLIANLRRIKNGKPRWEERINKQRQILWSLYEHVPTNVPVTRKPGRRRLLCAHVCCLLFDYASRHTANRLYVST